MANRAGLRDGTSATTVAVATRIPNARRSAAVTVAAAVSVTSRFDAGAGPRVVGLSVGGALHPVDDHEVAGHFVAGQRAPAVLLSVLERERHARARLDDRDDPLAPALVGYPDDDGVLDGGVVEEHLLDLLGEDLLATGVDGQRRAAVQHDGPVRIDGRVVARQGPAHTVHLDEGRCGLLGILVVADR